MTAARAALATRNPIGSPEHELRCGPGVNIGRSESDEDAESCGVAEVHARAGTRGNSALARTWILGRWLLLVPPASGIECVRALQQAGFRVRLQDGRQMLLARDDRVVRVPLLDRLRPQLLVAILRSAGIAAAEFTSYLGAHGP